MTQDLDHGILERKAEVQCLSFVPQNIFINISQLWHPIIWKKLHTDNVKNDDDNF